MTEIRVAAAGRGAAWLIDGFSYFARDAGTWIGLTLILFLISIVSNFIPLGGLALQIASPIFAAGLMLGCAEQDGGGAIRLSHLFMSFSDNDRIGSLVMIGVLYLAGVLLIVIAVMVLGFFVLGGSEFFMQLFVQERLPDEIAVATDILLVTLVGLLLYLPLLMAIWFAPALVVLSNEDAVSAMKLSFNGCVRNMVPFLLYGLVGLVLCVAATLPLMLGWLIFFPMFVASVYISWKEIFPRNAAATPTAPPG